MNSLLTDDPARRTAPDSSGTTAADPVRPLDWRRLKGTAGALAMTASLIAALAQAFGTVVAGWLAHHATTALVGLLAACLLGSGALDAVGRLIWAGVVDRAEGNLRTDLLTATMRQPVEALTEQAVGEILDRVDDDTHELGNLSREIFWRLAQTVFAVPALYVVAGVSWWPAWVLFPIAAVLTFVLIRGPLREIGVRKVLEEAAWTDHAAALEEAVAGRDDLRTSLGQAHAIRRLATLSARIHRRFADVVILEGRTVRRSGLMLHCLLVATVIIGVGMVSSGGMSVSELVTVFLAATLFVGQVDQASRQLPDLQAGVGAIIRLRQLLGVPAEPVGGRPVAAGQVGLRFDHLEFAYAEGTFGLRDIDIDIPAGTTCALVGRSGSGKSTLASLVTRTMEPRRGTVYLGDSDVLDLDLQQLRSAVGVVTQRTEILAGTLAENITLFEPFPREQIEAAIDQLALGDWVGGLPEGLDTPLGPGGLSISAGEEQLVAFARLLVRDVKVVILDEATARMDPLTERRVVAAADRLLTGRTGIVVAHRLSTTERAQSVAVLEHGRVIQHGPREALASRPGPFRDLLDAAGSAPDSSSGDDTDVADVAAASAGTIADRTPATAAIGAVRRQGPPPPAIDVPSGPSLARGVWSALRMHPRWCVGSIVLFSISAVTGSLGALSGFLWGKVVQDLTVSPHLDRTGFWLMLGLVGSLLIGPLLISVAVVLYPQWWIAVLLRSRMQVLVGQTGQHRLPRRPAGEIVGRALDSDRFASYADNWVDVFTGVLVIAVTSVLGGTIAAGGVLLAVMVGAMLASLVGRGVSGRSAAAASTSRANFGRALVSALDCVRTIKLAAAMPAIHEHLRQVDGGRVEAAVREHRVAAVLSAIPNLMVQGGVVAAWAIYLRGGWDIATALLVSSAVSGFGWFGETAGKVITRAPGARAWQVATSQFAGGADLMALPAGVDLVAGIAPAPAVAPRTRLDRLRLHDLSAIHDDGTIGVEGVDLTVQRGELVLLVGQVGSGKSSLLSALAGLIGHTGGLSWNDVDIEDPQTFLRPGQVAHVSQVPRVLSGTFADNIRLDHDRSTDRAIADARLAVDIADAGGANSLVGHRGVRLSGGQVQRLALARALAADAELLLADDVSSALDAATELELWQALRSRGTTVLGSTSKAAALDLADRVVVLVDGQVAAEGPWRHLADDWGHLAA